MEKEFMKNPITKTLFKNSLIFSIVIALISCTDINFIERSYSLNWKFLNEIDSTNLNSNLIYDFWTDGYWYPTYESSWDSTSGNFSATITYNIDEDSDRDISYPVVAQLVLFLDSALIFKDSIALKQENFDSENINSDTFYINIE